MNLNICKTPIIQIELEVASSLGYNDCRVEDSSELAVPIESTVDVPLIYFTSTEDYGYFASWDTGRSSLLLHADYIKTTVKSRG
jgi:hypothetical protein